MPCMMQWICFAEQPLTPTALYSAMSYDYPISDVSRSFDKDAESSTAIGSRIIELIRTLSGGLAEAIYLRNEDRKKCKVQLIHQSVNDFLLSKGLRYLMLSASPAPASQLWVHASDESILGYSHQRLSHSCANRFRDAGSIDSIQAVNSDEAYYESQWGNNFMLYAMCYCFSHANKAERYGVPMQSLVQLWADPTMPAFGTWVNMCRELHTSSSSYPTRPRRGSNLLHAAVTHSLSSVIEALFEAEREQKDDEDNALLYYAARWNNKDLIKKLLQVKIDIDAHNRNLETALIVASKYEHVEVVKLLINGGADINATIESWGCALQIAAGTGNAHLTQLLLHAGADVNLQRGKFGNALQAASSQGNEHVVQILLEAEADVNAQSGKYENALQAASLSNKQQNIVQRLLEAEADVNARGGRYGSALQAASSQGNEHVVQILLEAEADVNAQSGKYENALQTASIEANEEIIEILLEAGADVNARGEKCGSALQAAAFEGYDFTVQILLEAGADVNARGGKYGSALKIALSSKARRESTCLVPQLIDAGAHVDPEDAEDVEELLRGLMCASRLDIIRRYKSKSRTKPNAVSRPKVQSWLV